MRPIPATALAALMAGSLATGVAAQSSGTKEDASMNADHGSGHAAAGLGTTMNVQGTASGGTVGLEATSELQAQVNAPPNENEGLATMQSQSGLGHGIPGTAGPHRQLIADLAGGSMPSPDMIADIGSEADVQTVTLSDLTSEAADNARSLQQGLEEMTPQLDGLRQEIAANTTLSDRLEAKGYSAADVVAVDTANGGAVTLVIDDVS